jgi:hypothetical protein
VSGQEYLQLHLTREAEGQRLIASAGYYVYNYDTAVWGVAAILAKLTDLPQYHTHIRTFLKAWVELKPPKLDPQLVRTPGKEPRQGRCVGRFVFSSKGRKTGVKFAF